MHACRVRRLLPLTALPHAVLPLPAGTLARALPHEGLVRSGSLHFLALANNRLLAAIHPPEASSTQGLTLAALQVGFPAQAKLVQ